MDKLCIVIVKGKSRLLLGSSCEWRPLPLSLHGGPSDKNDNKRSALVVKVEVGTSVSHRSDLSDAQFTCMISQVVNSKYPAVPSSWIVETSA